MRLKTASHRSADISNRSLHSGGRGGFYLLFSALVYSALLYSALICSNYAEISVGEMPK